VADTVHAPERPQGVEVGIDGEGPGEEDFPDRRTDIFQELPPHAHPALAAGQSLRHFGHAHAVDRQQVHEEPGLLQQAQGLVLRDAHEFEDGRGLVVAQRHVGDHLDAQLLRTTVAFEAVEQDVGLVRVHALQWFLDAPFGDRGPHARFPSVVSQSIALVPQVQGG
jgi:hypothetical protein